MAILIAFPIVIGLTIIQTAILSHIPLLRGTPDLVLLTVMAWALQKNVKTAWHWGIIAGLLVGVVSALPYGTLLLGYCLSVGVCVLLRKRVWQVPLLAMFVATLAGTFIMNLVSMLTLQLSGYSFPVMTVFNLITLPSLLLNLLLAIPIYAVIGSLADRLYPVALES
jgi:rod shape-determining protein MreD